MALTDEEMQTLVQARRVLGTRFDRDAEVAYDCLKRIVTTEQQRGQRERIYRGCLTIAANLDSNGDVAQALRGLRDLLDGEEPF